VDFTSHSNIDREAMLRAIGSESIDKLVRSLIPEDFLFCRKLGIPDGASEFQLTREFGDLAAANATAETGISFLGGGAYDHYLPAAIPHLLGRSEFYTAYTPYQAEVSQGTLQTIYEFQTMVCRLTGMDAASASHYDGATALAEGVILAARKTKRNRVVVSHGLNPLYRQVLQTYCEPVGIDVVGLQSDSGRIGLNDLSIMAKGAAAVVIQHPNFFGQIEPAAEAARIAHDAGAIAVASSYPLSLALLEPPGAWGADIATAEGQPFGIPTSLGGPYVGLFAVKKDLVRLMPGRLVARTKDKNSKDGFVLTLQTREQHIRREKATSNICTNEALLALAALIYLSLVGPDGLKRAALNSYRGAHYLADKLKTIKGCRLKWEGGFFNEFTLELPRPASEVAESLIQSRIFAGPDLGRWFKGMENCIQIAVTEKRTHEELDRFDAVLRESL